ncbi:MAG TPA: dihydrodipicolinate synthase family protein [Pseudolysinimonas sp.]|nr:dihydrodipicolinate synthase family protein [Pseudolysinimonas sp.]
MTAVRLPSADGSAQELELRAAPAFGQPATALRSRVAYAAAHVIPHAWADNTPGRPAELDWDATLAFRHHLWSWGLGVADAMDTAQRNMGLDWAATAELIRRSAAEARSVGGDLVVGVNTDHLPDAPATLDEVVAAYLLQLEVAEDAGAGVVLMASRHLAAAAESPSDYERVYREVLARTGAPVVLHWLGEAFDTRLAGYFGAPHPEETVLRIMGENAEKVRGIKMSLLDAGAERALRARLPETQRMFTGDDFHYVGLIAEGSDALLGAFAAVAPAASAAVQALDSGDAEAYRLILEPTEALARQVFAAPTQFYKTGVAFLAWLNGHQPSFTMVGGLHAGRSIPHLAEIVRLADAAGALEKPELAAERWSALLELNGLA